VLLDEERGVRRQPRIHDREVDVVLLVEQQPWVAAHEVEVAAPLRVSWACQLSPTVTVRCLWVCVRLRAQTRPAPSSYTSGGGGGRRGGG
jgi:hypothetical protein